MIDGFFPDEPGDDTTADWSSPPGDVTDGWLDLPEYPQLEPDETLTPDLDRALDAVLAAARLDPLPDDTWEHLLTTAFTSPDPSEVAMSDPHDDLDVEFPDGTTVTNPDQDALGYVYQNYDDYLHGNDPHEVEELTFGGDSYESPDDPDPGAA